MVLGVWGEARCCSYHSAAVPGFPGLQPWNVRAFHPCKRRQHLHVPRDVVARERVVLVGDALDTALCQGLWGAVRLSLRVEGMVSST